MQHTRQPLLRISIDDSSALVQLRKSWMSVGLAVRSLCVEDRTTTTTKYPFLCAPSALDSNGLRGTKGQAQMQPSTSTAVSAVSAGDVKRAAPPLSSASGSQPPPPPPPATSILTATPLSPTSLQPTSPSAPPLLRVQFESQPLHDAEAADSRLTVHLESLDVVVNMRVIGAVGQFFSPPENLDLAAVKDKANEQLARVRAYVCCRSSTRLLSVS
jgi:hypothetical protein